MKLIDKSALVAEIERRRDAALMRQQNLEAIGQETVSNEMVAFELDRIISFINTLEVKEVDLEKEIAFQWEGCDCDDINLYAKVSSEQFKAIAKHFFELGLKVIKGE